MNKEGIAKLALERDFDDFVVVFWVFANRHNLLGLRRFEKQKNNDKSAKPRPNGVLQLPLKQLYFICSANECVRDSHFIS